jgi:alginate O-acetyltransferase complex protein AlgI
MRIATIDQKTLATTLDCVLQAGSIAIATLSLAAAIGVGAEVAPWARMWGVAFALFVFLKWLTWSRRSPRYSNVGRGMQIGYLFGWVGLDADEFCAPAAQQAHSTAREWLAALSHTLLAMGVLWGGIRFLPADRPIVIGAVGMAGIILLLHFGLFHLLALVWRCFSVVVQPIMRHPFASTSLADFWGRRWNRAYRRVSFEYFFRPFVRWIGPPIGTLLAFLASGLIHESVISYPADAGYGGPTAYFAIQGLALLLERTVLLQKFMESPLRGWCYTAVFVVGPVGLLFHAPFLTRVIVPFLELIGAR